VGGGRTQGKEGKFKRVEEDGKGGTLSTGKKIALVILGGGEYQEDDPKNSLEDEKCRQSQGD